MNLARAAGSEDPGESAAAGLHRIHIEAAVGELLARLFHGSSGLDVRKDTPLGIRDPADKFTHTLYSLPHLGDMRSSSRGLARRFEKQSRESTIYGVLAVR